MQNASTSQQPQAGSTTWNTAPTSNVFPHASQPRSASTPKLLDGDRRGDTFQQQQYSGYTSQPQYSPTGLTYYPNQTLQGYRRTSNPKASTPPSSAPPPTNASPTSQYYPRNDYTPQSAPPQMTSQPQTAHPYGNYYPGYYDYAAHTYPRQPSGSTTTPTLPHTPTMADRPAEYPSGYSYDPRQYQARPQQYYPQHQYFQWPGYGYPQQQPGHQSTPAAAPPQPPHSAPPPSKKRKKDDMQQPVIIKEEEEVEDKSKSKKKGKKEDVPPKLPAKSHLHPPRQAQSAWQLFFTDELNKAKAAAASGSSPGGTPHSAKLNVAQIAKDAGTAYGLLAGEQKEYYARKVQESKDQYAKELLAWQATLTPEDIRLENAFRAQQRKDGKSRKGNLKDPNAPKKPLSAYFLFLKSIREDDALRARVWGDESETTKQSVMAAEKWRALSDTEKRPYLSKAEKDKQDYEVARKIYEADATARARGEIVPDRPHIEIQQTHVETPQSLKPDSETLLPSLPVKSEAELDFSSLKPEKKDLEFSSPDHPTYDQFAGFNDPLEGIDLPGLDPMVDNQEQWDDLHHLMGENQKAREKSDEDKVDAKEAEAFESMSAFIADPAD